jgi:vacuolar-type H+-ATPase subunit I/STV1
MYNVILSATIGKFIGALQGSLANYALMIASLIGIAMVVVGIFQLAKNLISHGKGQTNWAVTFGLIIVGSMVAMGTGWKFVGDMGKTGGKTLSSAAITGKADDQKGDFTSDPFN